MILRDAKLLGEPKNVLVLKNVLKLIGIKKKNSCFDFSITFRDISPDCRIGFEIVVQF